MLASWFAEFMLEAYFCVSLEVYKNYMLAKKIFKGNEKSGLWAQ